MNENSEKKDLFEDKELDAETKIRIIDSVIAKYSEKISESASRAAIVETAVSASFKKKIIVMVTAVCVAFVTFISSTFAYFSATIGSQGNMIQTGNTDFEYVDLVYPPDAPDGVPSESVSETFSAFPGETIKRTVGAVNRGGVTVYVRAKIDTDITLKDEYSEYSDIIDTSLIVYDINDDSWVTRDVFDGYYYYIYELPRGAKSPDFLNGIMFSDNMGNIYKGATVKFKLTFEAVQATENGETVFDAIGWPMAEEGGNP